MIDVEKVRLDLVVSPGTCLMYSIPLLNTQSTLEYNYSLKKASSDIKLGVYKSVNLEMKLVILGHMNGGSSKINRPRSEGSRPSRDTSQAFGRAAEQQIPRG